MREDIIAVLRNGDINLEERFNKLSQCLQEHCRRTARATRNLLHQTMEEGIYQDEIQDLPLERAEQAALYHDIGLTLIPETLLTKTEDWTGAERRVYQQHAVFGGKLIEQYRRQRGYLPEEEPIWRLAAEIAMSHHERWDGKGYPYGSITNAISVAARATSIADTYFSIVYGTPHRMPLPPEYALLQLKEEAGKEFDPALVKVFIKAHPLFQQQSAS